MNALVLMVQVQGGGQIQQIAETFGVDWPHLISQMISFCILCFLLQRFAYKPVLKMLESRRQVITESFANADKVKAELARAETHRQQAMVEANVQAKQFIDEARVSAERLLKQETNKATAAAQEIIVRARQATEQDYASMLAELKREVGRLVVETTSAVTGKILTTEDQRRLAEETERQLAA
jgi:F-type H+-transporting ATPase subunit b